MRPVVALFCRWNDVSLRRCRGLCLSQAPGVLPVVKVVEAGVALANRSPPGWVRDVPVDRLVQRLEPIAARLPTELLLDARGIEPVAPVVARPVFDVAD
jgi:hypothetical protein